MSLFYFVNPNLENFTQKNTPALDLPIWLIFNNNLLMNPTVYLSPIWFIYLLLKKHYKITPEKTATKESAILHLI
jgi:hypothetical protein